MKNVFAALSRLSDKRALAPLKNVENKFKTKTFLTKFIQQKKLQIFDMTLKIDKTLLTSHFLMLFLDHILKETKKSY